MVIVVILVTHGYPGYSWLSWLLMAILVTHGYPGYPGYSWLSMGYPWLSIGYPWFPTVSHANKAIHIPNEKC